MAESLHIPPSGNRADIYQSLLPQLEALIAGETDAVANMANVVAALKQAFGFFWVGMYVVKNNELVLGPFQGPIACTRIAFGKGVCGAAWQRAETIVVPDVEAFPGHIACSSLSKSEIVIPIKNAEGNVIAVLDIDSDQLHDFSETDAVYGEKIAALLCQVLEAHAE